MAAKKAAKASETVVSIKGFNSEFQCVPPYGAPFQYEVGETYTMSGCKRMRHPIVVWDSETHFTFFEADMDKVNAFEAARTPVSAERMG